MILRDACEDFAAEWLCSVPGASALVPLVSKSLLDGTRAAYRSTARPGQSEDAWARSVFAVPKAVPDDVASEEMVRRMMGFLPPDARSYSSALTPSPATPPTPDSEESPDDPDAVIRDLSLGQPQATTLHSFTAFGAKPPSPSGGDDLDLIREFIDFLKEQLKKHGENTYIRALMEDMEKEMLVLPERLALAAAMQAIYSRMGFPKSDLEGGKAIHKFLQERYRQVTDHLSHQIVIERRVWRGGSFTPLRMASREAALAGNYNLAALRMARISRTSRRGHRRDDILDMTREGGWEIKPVSSAVEGVVQEAYYRFAYNFWAAVWIDGWGRNVDPAVLDPGENWLRVHIPLLFPFIHPRNPKQLVTPWTMDYLPGLAFYFIFDIKLPQKVPDPIIIFEMELMRAIEEMRRRAREEKSVPQPAPLPAPAPRPVPAPAPVPVPDWRPSNAFQEILRALLLILLAIVIIAAILAAEAVLAVVLLIGGVITLLFTDDKAAGPSMTSRTPPYGAGSPKTFTLHLPGCTIANISESRLEAGLKKARSVFVVANDALVESFARPATA